jgi:sulfur-oxidizing protein SoxY
MRPLTRRETLILGIAGAVAVSAGSPRVAHATAADAAAAIARFTGGKTPVSGPITIEAPEIAENGNSISLTVAVESPMNPNDYVTEIFVVAEGNPWPGVATFKFTPMSGRAEAVIRIRLATSQNVIAVAKTSNGAVLTAQRAVKVTVGGCGG